MSNLDYSKENQYLPETLRLLCGEPNRVTKTIEYDYLRMHNYDERLAILNNYRAYEIATGFVQAVHYSNLMTGTAPRLKKILIEKICSRIRVEGADNELDKFRDAYKESKLTKDLKIAFDNAITTGRGVMALNFIDGKVKIRHFNAFRVKLVRDTLGDIIRADLYLKIRKTTAFDNYTIIERRYFNSDNQACQKYVLAKVSYNRENDLDSRIIEVEKIDDNTKKLFEGITFNRQIVLEGFDDLGVYYIDNDVINNKYPYADVPESQFVNVQDLLVEREISETYKVIDKQLGRGRVIKPSFMKTSFTPMAVGNVAQMTVQPIATGMAASDKTIFTQYESMTMEDCKPQSIQFDLRSEQWRNDISGLVGDICAAFGITVLDFDPRLLQMGQRTDDEINAMTDITRATVMDKREINEDSINTFINQIGKLVGINSQLSIRWSMSSILNPSKNSQLITMQLSNGTISRKKAIARENPDYTDREVEEELKLIEQERAAVDYNKAFEEF